MFNLKDTTTYDLDWQQEIAAYTSDQVVFETVFAFLKEVPTSFFHPAEIIDSTEAMIGFATAHPELSQKWIARAREDRAYSDRTGFYK